MKRLPFFCLLFFAGACYAETTPSAGWKISYIERSIRPVRPQQGGGRVVLTSRAESSAIVTKTGLDLWSQSDMLVIDTASARYRDCSLEFTVTPHNELAQVGAVVRYLSDSSWVYVGCDNISDNFGYAPWFIETPKGRTRIANDIAKLYKEYPRRIRIDCIGQELTVRIDGEKIAQTVLPAFAAGSEAGHYGFRVFRGGDAAISDIAYRNQNLTPERLLNMSAPHTLDGGDLVVNLYGPHPTPFRYIYKGDTLSGAASLSPWILVNGQRYNVRSRTTGTAKDLLRYLVTVPEIGVEMEVECRVEGNVFTRKVLNIKEDSIKVKTLAWGDPTLVSLSNRAETAALTVAWGEGGDGFFPLNRATPDTVVRTAAIAVLNDSRVAVSMDNNSMYESKQFLFQRSADETALGSNEWIYRGLGDEVTELPWESVIFADDRNQDNRVDWQDGAVALAEQYPTPYGAEWVRNANITINMNFASEGQYPFLRQLDNLKKVYYLTDGFGQMIELKGYQSQGHDSAHPDYAGNYNTRAGGLADLKTLIHEGLKYNARVGVHINHSESYPEAHAFNDTIVTRIPGWTWLDKSYLINKEVDHLNGTFQARLDAMKSDLPELSFIYLDTYREHRFLAWKTAKLFNERGWTIWTEDPGVFNRYGTWIHYHPDSKSIVSRFVHGTRKDGFAYDSLLLGGYGRGADIGFEGWQSGRDMNLALKNFYTKQLPLRYLMHHPLLYRDAAQARFRDGVETRRANGITTLYKDGNPIFVEGKRLFIPWDPASESKILHYNVEGGSSTWSLPKSWSGARRVLLYKLTDRGRQALGAVAVRNGQVTLTAEAGVPYVLYKAAPAPLLPADWSYASPVKDMGFDSRSTAAWKPAGNARGVHFDVTPYGQSYLSLGGKAQTGVQQTIGGLKPGQSYSLTAWVQIDGIRPATLGVGNYGGPTVESSIAETSINTFVENTDKRRTRYQRLRVEFTLPQGADGTALIWLNASATPSDTARVAWDDVRLMEITRCQKEGYLYYQDFEHVDFGWGPFMLSRPSSCTTHLSERHDPYTAGDVINGNWSFKTLNEGRGEILRTMPSLLSFKQGTTYGLRFEYNAPTAGAYRVVVKSLTTGKTLLSEPLNGRGTLDGVFTPDADDYYIAILRSGNDMLVIDDFGIYLP